MKKGMTGSEIARHLGITRQAVSQTLKNGMKKIYNITLNDPNLAESPFEAAMAMMSMFGQEACGSQDIEDFYELFPLEIKKEIKADAQKIYTQVG